MRAKNKIVSGYLQEYQFTKKYGKLYLKCLEQEYAVNKMTVKSIQVLDCQEMPSLSSILVKGFILSKFFGLLGMVAGKWGNGAERKKKLTDAGYDYAVVQKKVNELLR